MPYSQEKETPWFAGGSEPGGEGCTTGPGRRSLLRNFAPGFRLDSHHHALEYVHVPSVADSEAQRVWGFAQQCAGQRNAYLGECHTQDHTHSEPGLEIRDRCGAGGQTASGVCGHHDSECAAVSLRRLWYDRAILGGLGQYPPILVPLGPARHSGTNVGLRRAPVAGENVCVVRVVETRPGLCGTLAPSTWAAGRSEI